MAPSDPRGRTRLPWRGGGHTREGGEEGRSQPGEQISGWFSLPKAAVEWPGTGRGGGEGEGRKQEPGGREA